MTAVIDWAPCVGLLLLCCVCMWQAIRNDRARDARAIVDGCEDLCRAAAADPYQLNEETDPS